MHSIRTRFAEFAALECSACQAPRGFTVLREVAQLQVTYCQADDGRLVCEGRMDGERERKRRSERVTQDRETTEKRGKGSFTQLIIPN